MKSKYVLFLFLPLLLACNSGPVEYPESDTQAVELIDQLIQNYGGERYAQSKIEFDFRDKSYGSLRLGGEYIYARIFEQEGKLYHDLLSNYGFSREIDGKPEDLPKPDQAKYTRSVNSVIYFALLPYGLNDAAVIKQYLGESELEGRAYHKIRVTFRQEGGGEDHDDVFVYWLSKENLSMDYFAYGYHTDGGGTRFRKAYNKRVVGGITFQDYINYKGSDDFDQVDNMDELFSSGKLEELSRIELKNIYASEINEDDFHPDQLKRSS